MLSKSKVNLILSIVPDLFELSPGASWESVGGGGGDWFCEHREESDTVLIPLVKVLKSRKFRERVEFFALSATLPWFEFFMFWCCNRAEFNQAGSEHKEFRSSVSLIFIFNPSCSTYFSS